MLPSTRRPRPRDAALLGIVAGTLVVGAAMGARQAFGLFVGPLAFAHALPVTLIAFAIAVHNLVWGAAQPIAGAAADRWGAAPVIAVGSVTLAAGLAVAALFPSGVMLVLGLGVLVGLGISGTTFGVVLTAVARAAPEEKRSLAMGLASAGGSAGQVLLVPLAQGTLDLSGTTTALLVLAACVLATAPLGILLDRGSAQGAPIHEATVPPMLESVAQALRHPGYRLLTLGFFACGFQLAFIGTHLPTYLTLCHMPVGLGATALSLIGLFNMAGSWGCGWLGGRFRPQHVLGWLYLIRSAAISLFVFLPTSETSVLVFAAVMGLTWLGTVPLTSGLVARVFGTRHLGTLFGVCFLSHQVGSFLGAGLGGVAFDLTGSYTAIWSATAVAGLMAAMLHFPIKDTPARIVTPAQA
jgi:predicted MFS family arabinose efflux permease